MNRFSLKGPAGQVLFLTWLLFGLYYASRFNYPAVLPLIRFDLALITFLLGIGIRLKPAIAVLIVIGFMIIMPDILLATYPSDILSRKLSATGMGFLTTFTSLAGILTNVVSGKIADMFQSFNAVVFSFAIMALIAAVLCLRIREKGIHSIERRARI